MSAAREYGYAVTLIEFDESESVRLRDTVRRLAELPVDGMVFNTNRTIEDFDEFEPLNGLPTIIHLHEGAPALHHYRLRSIRVLAACGRPSSLARPYADQAPGRPQRLDHGGFQDARLARLAGARGARSR